MRRVPRAGPRRVRKLEGGLPSHSGRVSFRENGDDHAPQSGFWLHKTETHWGGHDTEQTYYKDVGESPVPGGSGKQAAQSQSQGEAVPPPQGTAAAGNQEGHCPLHQVGLSSESGVPGLQSLLFRCPPGPHVFMSSLSVSSGPQTRAACHPVLQPQHSRLGSVCCLALTLAWLWAGLSGCCISHFSLPPRAGHLLRGDKDPRLPSCPGGEEPGLFLCSSYNWDEGGPLLGGLGTTHRLGE